MIYLFLHKKIQVFGRSTSIKKQKLLSNWECKCGLKIAMAKNDFQKIALSTVLITTESSGSSAINRYNWLSFNFQSSKNKHSEKKVAVQKCILASC